MPFINQRGLQLQPAPTNHPRDPLRWPSWLKLFVVLSTSLANFVSNVGGSGLSVAVPLLMQELQRSQGDVTRLLTLNFLFLGIGNIFWVPLAIKFGKRASMISSMLLQAGAFIWCAVATGYNSLLAARCVLGFAAASGESLVPEIVADIFFVHERGTMMSIYATLIAGGSAVGPLVAGFMVEYTQDTWRSFVWFCFALAMFNLVLLIFLAPESNFERPEPSTPTQQLQAYPDRKEDDTVFVENAASMATGERDFSIRTPALWEILQPIHYDKEVNFFTALISPLKLLVYPSLLWGIFVYAICLSPQIIMIFTMSPLLESPPYLFRADIVGLMQVAAIIGFLLACFGGGYLSDVINAIVVRRSTRSSGSGAIEIRPEQRLISLLPGMAIGPAGCILLAFACGHKLHWSAIAVGFGMVSFGTVYTPNIAITYIVHLHQGQAASALVLINILKNLVAFVFLYVAVDWVNAEGYVQVFMIMFLLNVVIVACAVPLYFFGRKKGRYLGFNVGQYADMEQA
ncbi:major facilitator superfamily domain-containing protein [Aspergillus pseudoustus]|uniref:Major facilitator superfamily domain-containing protein n=1 Tax=Aspergillus pseudoustus TaxID=1810923 RepID=A0ABR4JVV9_9EURO